MAVTDDIRALTAILVREHQGGKAEALRQQRGLAASVLAKACGCTASQLPPGNAAWACPRPSRGLPG